jgi:hypothetical protein
MLLRAAGKLVGVLLVFACIAAMEFYMLGQNEKADFDFEIKMGRDINRIARELKQTELEDKTVQTLKYALEDVQENTQNYVQRRSDVQFLSLILLMPMFAGFWIASTCHGQKKVVP